MLSGHMWAAAAGAVRRCWREGCRDVAAGGAKPQERVGNGRLGLNGRRRSALQASAGLFRAVEGEAKRNDSADRSQHALQARAGEERSAGGESERSRRQRPPGGHKE